MSARMLDRTIRAIVERDGWRAGTALENRVALRLSKWQFVPGDFIQQMPVGPYRIDFAAADVLIALEADGWHHFNAPAAAKDAERDSWLRSKGWIVCRVDDRHGEDAFQEQLCRVTRLIRAEREQSYQPGTAARVYARQQAKLAKQVQDQIASGVGAARTPDPVKERGLLAKFLREVPEEVTDPKQRLRMAQYGVRAHMARMTMKSAKVRRKRAEEAA